MGINNKCFFFFLNIVIKMLDCTVREISFFFLWSRVIQSQCHNDNIPLGELLLGPGPVQRPVGLGYKPPQEGRGVVSFVFRSVI